MDPIASTYKRTIAEGAPTLPALIIIYEGHSYIVFEAGGEIKHYRVSEELQSTRKGPVLKKLNAVWFVPASKEEFAARYPIRN